MSEVAYRMKSMKRIDVPDAWIKENQIPREEDGLINYNFIMQNWSRQLDEIKEAQKTLSIDRVIEILNNIYEESPENVGLVFQVLGEEA